MMRSFIVTVGLLSTISVSACTASQDEPKPTTTAAAPTPTRNVSVIVDKSVPALKEGRDYSVVASWPRVADRRVVGYRASLDKRHAIAVLSEVDAVDPSAEPDPRGQRLVEVDTRTAELKSLAVHGTPEHPRYITDVVVSGNFVVWTETESTALELLPWDIYSLDLRSKKERHLASSRDFAVKDPPPPSPTYDQQVTVVGDNVYFPAVDRVTENSIESSIYSVPLTNNANSVIGPRLIAPAANQVFADDSGLRVMLNGELVTWDPARGIDGRTGQALGANCGGFFGEGVAVLCNKAKNKLSIVDQDGLETVLDISAFDQDDEPASAAYLYANSRWVGFTVNGSQGYVFDLARMDVFKLDGVSNSPEFSVADHWLPNEQSLTRPPVPKKLQFLKLIE
jgi:hypothetical protein